MINKENCNPFPINTSKVYGRIFKFEEHAGNFNISLDLLNDVLVEADTSLSSNLEINRDFRPFYYGMSIEMLSEDGNIEFKRINDGDWYELTIEPVRAKGNGSSWLALCLITFSTSPVESEIYRITGIGKKPNKKMPKIEIPDKSVLRSSVFWELELLRLCYRVKLKLCNIKKLQILHIGQGFQSRLFNNCDDFVCYDIGSSKCCDTDKTINRRLLDYDNLRAVILSHWDEDHILGAFNSSSLRPLDVPWFAPASIHSHNAKRLAFTIYLRNNLNLHLVDFPLLLSCSDSCDFIPLPKSTNLNNNGICMFIHKNDKRVLSIGDAEYSRIPFGLISDMDNKLDYLVVSHHGAEMKSKPPAARNQFISKAIIPVGKNIYEHPKNKTLKTLKKLGYLIHRTDYDGEITITF